ncbi:MAG: Glu/Leu/Phe/Val dehydrogenase [Flavobacteriales bacterium]|nr:Glu/Leu/Phe/Val dehydrogenase [Flavobacteriales bacterium]
MLEVPAKKTEGTQEVLSQMNEMNHEQVVFCQDERTGLKAIIAIHNTVLGPSLGGTRMWSYSSEAEAVRDVLRLSRGMTYKSAISGLNLGGGKAVIIGDSRKDKSEALFRRFGQFVDSLGGKYITAEDVGISPSDLSFVAMETDYVAGLSVAEGGSGDPSPVTAHGVYMGMKGAAKFAFGTESLEGKKIAVQGVGHVGTTLVEKLVKEGAKVTITDIHQDLIKNITDRLDVQVVSPEDIYAVDMDIYAPCALGSTVNDETLKALKCRVIAGAANNQLAEESKHGKVLLERDIVYAPDFLVNAGGIINCYAEVAGFERDWAMGEVEKIYDTTQAILKLSRDESIPSHLAATRMAEERVVSVRNISAGY